jgi:serine/threonine protein kinase
MGMFDHPFIVKCLDFNFKGRVLTIRMEMGQQDLTGLRMDDAELERVAGQVASALQALHSRGVLHGDVKPANLLLFPGNVVKLADFGLARKLTDPPRPVQGTPYYLPPEAVFGQVGTETDVWGLGCTLYELKTGKRIFQAKNLVDLSKEITTAKPYLN